MLLGQKVGGKKPPIHELTLSHELFAVVFGNLHHL